MSVKIKENNNAAEMGLQDQNPIFQAWKDIKDSIFNVLFVLLDRNDDDGDESMFGLIFESGLDYLQMMVFPFEAAVIMVWNGGQTLTNVTKMFTQLNLSTYLPSINFSTFLIMVYVLIFIIIMVILDIIYVSYSFSKKKFRFTWPLVLLAQIVPLFVTVLFLPITETLFSVVQCENNPQIGKQVMSSFPDIVCWEGWHLFHSVITLLFTSIFVFISSVVGLALFEPRMTTNKLTARQNSTGQIVFIVNKIVTQFVFSFTPFEESWIYCTMLFVLSGWLFWTYNMQDPYYEKNASKFFRITSTYYFWTNFMLIVSQLLLSTGFNGGLVIWMSGLPFIWVVIVFDKQSNIDKLFSSNLKFRSGEDLEAHLKYVLQLIQNQQKDKNSYMLLIGYIEKHKEVCTEEDCPLKVFKRKKDAVEMEENTVQLIKQLERMYKLGIKKYPSCTRLRLSLAFFHLERTKNKKKAYQEFSNAQKTDPAFEEEFIIYRFKKIIRQNLEDNKENNSDLIEIIRFDNHVFLCEEAMVLSARLHKEFWLELKEQIPDLKKLNKIGSRITETVNVVRENYREIEKINNTVPEVLHNFSLYLILIQQDSSQGKQLLAQAQKVYQDKIMAGEQKLDIQLDPDNIEDDEGAVVLVSARTGAVGKILKVNLRFNELVGYPKEELCERSIEKFMPECLAGNHEFCLKQWLKEEDVFSQYFSRNNSNFLRHKSGFLVPVTYRVRFRPEQQQFITVFRQDNTRAVQCHLITDDMGNILDTSALGYTYFGLDKASLCERKLRLQDLGMEHQIEQTLTNSVTMRLGLDNEKVEYKVKASSIQVSCNRVRDGIDDQEDDNLLTVQKKVVGYCVEIVRVGKDRKTYLDDNAEHDDSADQDAIMELYGTPNLIDLLAVEITRTEHKIAHEFINYGQIEKIKTMRLTNNEIKMVYNQSNDDYCGQEANNTDNEGEYQLFKIDDENYQRKIKKAINTNLDHVEVRRLKCFSFFFLLSLFTVVSVHLVMTIFELSRIQLIGETLLYKTQQTDFLMRRISNTFLYSDTENRVDPTSQLATILNHTIKYQVPEDIDILLQDGVLVQKRAKDAMIFMESQLAQYAQWQNPETISNIFYNYINNLYPHLENSDEDIELSLMFSYGLLSSAGVLGLAMTCVWIYVMLLIDKKRFDIMIWFLDIPIPYVGFLGNHCDKYLKTFVGIRELMEKGFNLEEKEYYFESYSEKKGQNEEELEEQQKARKTLIARHKKETLLSKLNISYLRYSWVVFYATIFSVIAVVTSMAAVNVFNFLEPQWITTYKQLLWSGSLDIAFYAISDQKPVQNTSVPLFLNEIRGNYLNIVTENQLRDFNNDILDFSIAPVADSFKNTYLKSMCDSVDNRTYCQSLLDGKLKGGYAIFAKYLYQAEIERRAEYREANRRYIAPAFVDMIRKWQISVNQQVQKTLSLSSITLYVYVIVSVLVFLIIWTIYLRKLNTEINQTIQMLNMIPLKLLPKSRKETRQFIVWIIREANKKQHEQD